MSATSDRRRLLDKLLRDVARSEAHAIEHAAREAPRLGETPPVLALREVAAHALAMRARFEHALEGHGLPPRHGAIGATLSKLCRLVGERLQDGERAYRAALLDLRHGIGVVRVLREVARFEERFALIRWCDDWLIARRTAVARVEAQLPWFAGPSLANRVVPASQAAEDPSGERAKSSHDSVDGP